MPETSMNFRKDHPVTGTPNSGVMGKDFVYRPVSISLNRFRTADNLCPTDTMIHVDECIFSRASRTLRGAT